MYLLTDRSATAAVGFSDSTFCVAVYFIFLVCSFSAWHAQQNYKTDGFKNRFHAGILAGYFVSTPVVGPVNYKGPASYICAFWRGLLLYCKVQYPTSKLGVGLRWLNWHKIVIIQGRL